MDHKGAKIMSTIVFNTCHIAQPSQVSVWRGVRSAFNLSGSTRCDYHFVASADEADHDAILNDWYAVHEDLDTALDRVLH